VNRRLKLTKEVIKKNKIKLAEYSLSGKNKLEQAMEMLQFGSWLTFYVGILNNINPSLIFWVDWFKKELKG
jgi:glucose/mannose-6-phosphate isomerase